ncbi:hypothetical protein IM753_03100 [Moraxella sp. K127]|uniref:hypothetical protein n=1 Tax=Moraxella sp. K127 TaxID=2780079 RepID=UPI00188187A0|nr:hypothetical protein [Moraxella sp. K127]MBE9589979.1 hypothetical protein [Moraxella sp. K127]
MTKPTPIIIGVQGFNAFQAKPEPVPVSRIDWQKISGLTYFEKYAKEHNVQDIIHFINDEIERYGEEMAYERYTNWFYNTGLWLNETPMGELIT